MIIRYAGRNPVRWALVIFTIWSAFCVFAWKVLLNWISILLMALFLVGLLVGIALVVGIGFGRIFIALGWM